MESKDLSNLTIKKEEYSINGNKVTCTLTCKANLKEFEKETFYFNDLFIKDVISLYMPIIKIIRAYNSYSNGVVAKYYIMPGGKARILYFDNEYFNIRNKVNKEYKNPKTYNYHKNDVIRVKDVCNASFKMGESNEYTYLDTFVVTGNANCVSTDTFNENTGKLIANANAMIKANTRIAMVYHNLIKKFDGNNKLLEKACTSVSDQVQDLCEIISRI